jgi:hypothetical protein
MSPNDSQGPKRRNLNHKNYVLNLPTGTRIYVKNRLYDRNRKIRNYTLFFRLDKILPANGLTKKKTEPISAKKIT